MKQHCTVILGSQSPRRKALLSSWGIDVNVVVPIEKNQNVPTDPIEMVQAIAQQKMDSLQLPEGMVCITADTIVHFDGKVLGKPGSEKHAREMIQSLSGTTHVVSTAYVIKGDEMVSRVVNTAVTMKKIVDREIDWYLKKAEYMDKAGAYGVQEHAGTWVTKLEGSLTNVIGLPMDELIQDLIKLNVISL